LKGTLKTPLVRKIVKLGYQNRVGFKDRRDFKEHSWDLQATVVKQVIPGKSQLRTRLTEFVKRQLEVHDTVEQGKFGTTQREHKGPKGQGEEGIF